MKLVRVVAPHFVAGFVLENDRVTRECAPILWRALYGLNEDMARKVIKARGWKAYVITNN